MEYTILVVALAHEAAPIKWIRRKAGTKDGEHFLFNGKHAACFYDDLSKHADAYRQLSLLLRRPPGREAFPGDVFYLHSRLLERSCKLGDDLGGGSLTGIPIVETQAGDVAAYILTNVISRSRTARFSSSPTFFYSGVRPAINVGISVSRGGRLGADQGDIRSLGAYASTSPSTDEAPAVRLELELSTGAALNRGEKMVSTLNQPQQAAPWPVEEQVVAIFAGTRGSTTSRPTRSRGSRTSPRVPGTEGLPEGRSESGEPLRRASRSGSKSRSTSSRTFNIQEEKSLVA